MEKVVVSLFVTPRLMGRFFISPCSFRYSVRIRACDDEHLATLPRMFRPFSDRIN